MWWTYLLTTGSVLAALGIGAGAFGAHALKEQLTPPDLAIYETAIKYWMYHALGVCVVALLMTRIENNFIKSSAISMIVGTLIFSGSLIALVLTGQRFLGAITPIGGVLLILAWTLLAVGVIAHG